MDARIGHAVGRQSDVKMIHPTVVAVVGTEEGMECSSTCVAFEPVQCDKRLTQVAEGAVQLGHPHERCRLAVALFLCIGLHHPRHRLVFRFPSPCRS